MLAKILAVSCGAILGVNGRFLLGVVCTHRWGTQFPYSTFIANLSGSFLIGVMMVLALTRYQDSDGFRLFWVTGLLGGFTTFSSFSFEAMTLIQHGRYLTAAGYIVGSVVGSLAGVVLGTALARALLD